MPEPAAQGPQAPYLFVRTIFRCTLGSFYGSVQVSGGGPQSDSERAAAGPSQQPLVPPGKPTILVANHGNGLIDAKILITALMQAARDDRSGASTSNNDPMLRLTAKSTLWSNPFWRFFMDGVGTIPVKRRLDFGTRQDNTDAFGKFSEVLQRYEQA